jgi:general secretion pathway protein D
MKSFGHWLRTARAGAKAGLACAALLAAAATIASAQSGQSGGELITPNFKDADIGQVAEAVSMATHKNFVLDPRVRAQVTMLSTTPMSPAAFYQTFLAILQVHGFIAVPSGNVVKIVPDAEERYMPGNVLPSEVSPSSDEIVTQVVKVHNVSAVQLVPVLRPLVPNQGQLSAYPPANILIISDRAANVSRLIRIIHRIDQSDTSNIDVIPLQNASASQVARVVSQLYQGSAESTPGGTPLKLIADERSNSILLSGDATARLRARALIAHLDTPSSYGGDTQVRYLKYEDAVKLAPKLKDQIQAMQQATAAAKGSSPAEQPGAGTQIWADAQNNALIITAPPKTMAEINSIIDKLDIRQPEVLVQAIIVDVDVNKSTELGVNWAVYSNGSTIPGATFLTPVGGASLVDLADAIASPTSLTSASALANGTTIALGSVAKTGLSFAAMLRALQTSDDSNIIATPSTVTMNHQEATIKVAEQVPFVTGQYSSTATTVTATGTVTPFQTIENETVGTILKITPEINSSDSLILKIHIESSSLLPASSAGGAAVTTVDPTMSQRTVDTEVLVKNGGILVIGGLISNEYDRNKTGVPLLSHIPLLGQLFSDREGAIAKKDLMIFIRPQILDSGGAADAATDAEYQFIRKEQKSVGEKELIPLVPGAESSLLPAPPKSVPPSHFKGCCDITTIPQPSKAGAPSAKQKAAPSSPAPATTSPAPATTSSAAPAVPSSAATGASSSSAPGASQ